MDVSGGKRSLPKSAYRPLEEGEVYTPYIPSDTIIPEITVRSVFLGALMAALFTLATAVSGLRAGQVFEAAIPIAILAIGLGKIFKRKNTILENVIIQSIGSASGVVVAGAIFTLPTLFMLELEPSLLEIFLTALLGGVLGIVMLIPLRRYFVKDMHGQFPFPEATAVNEILVTGEKAGNQASVLTLSMIVGGMFDFVADGLRFWNSKFEWNALGGFFKDMTEKTKMVFKLDSLAFFVGLGYIVGLKYATIIVMGSFMSWFIFVPLLGYVFSLFPQGYAVTIGSSELILGNLEANAIFSEFVRNIGIGAIAAAGIIGIIKNLGVIVSSFSVGFKGIFNRVTDEHKTERADTDMNMTLVLGIIGLALVAMAMFFFFVVDGNITYAIVGLLIAFIISFLFTTVAARAIAIVGTNPVSGMTLMTLILTSAILVSIGLSGNDGKFIALVIGGVVCTALSMSGGFITDLKVGYWLGATPAKQQQWKFLGTIIAALVVGVAIILIHNAYGFETLLDKETGKKLSPNIEALYNEQQEALVTTEDAATPEGDTADFDATADTMQVEPAATAAAADDTSEELSDEQKKALREQTREKGLAAYPYTEEQKEMLIKDDITIDENGMIQATMGANPDMPAPQANVMKSIINTFMDPDANVAWMLFGVGILFAILLDRIGVPALAFGLGMYLPQQLNTPLLLGAFIAYFLQKSTKDKDLAQARVQKGTLIASGFIAGAALFKILEAVLRVIPGQGDYRTFLDVINASYGASSNSGNFLLGGSEFSSIIGLVLVIVLCGWVFWSASKAEKEEEATDEQ